MMIEADGTQSCCVAAKIFADLSDFGCIGENKFLLHPI